MTYMRPLPMGALLRQTVSIFRRNFPVFFGIMGLPVLAIVVAGWIMVFALVPSGDHVDLRELWSRMGWPQKTFVFILFLGTMAAMFRAQAATVAAASEFHFGRPISIGQAFGRVHRKALRLFWLVFVTNMIARISVVLVLAAVVFAVYCTPALPVAILEERKVFDALKRSQTLTQGGYGRIVLLTLLYLFVALLGGGALFFVFTQTGPVLGRWGMRVIASASFWLFLLIPGLFMIALTLNYYDQLRRKENLTAASVLKPPAPSA